jgi:hypothetical protein
VFFFYTRRAARRRSRNADADMNMFFACSNLASLFLSLAELGHRSDLFGREASRLLSTLIELFGEILQ